MLDGAAREQHQFVAPLAERQEQREQHRAEQQPVADRARSTTTAPATARSTKPIATVSTSRITRCFSRQEYAVCIAT